MLANHDPQTRDFVVHGHAAFCTFNVSLSKHVVKSLEVPVQIASLFGAPALWELDVLEGATSVVERRETC